MSTLTPDLPAGQRETLTDDLAGMGSFYIDPAGAARRLHHKWFWVGPLLLVSAVSIVTGLIQTPLLERALETMQVSGGANPDQLAMVMKWRKFALAFSPVGVALVYAFNAAILLATGSVLAVKANFRNYFNLVAGCSLISMLALIAGTIVLKSKQEITSMAEMQPALGLDIFLPEGASKYLTAFLGFFSVFEIWWIVMAVLIASYSFRLSKGKASALVTPVTLLGLFFRLIGALFQRT